jgi:hypothetical protein
MPTFYLHTCDSVGFVEDVEGHDHSDLPSALRAAGEGLRDILASELRNGNLDTASFVQVENDQHVLVATVTFKDVVQMTHEAAARPAR